jgi:hypothetical protein
MMFSWMMSSIRSSKRGNASIRAIIRIGMMLLCDDRRTKETKDEHVANGEKRIRRISSFVFNEKVNINLSPDAYQEEIHNVFKRSDFYKQFQDYLEYMFSMGGMAVKVLAETDQLGVPQIKLSYVTAECFIPLSYSNGHITGGGGEDTARYFLGTGDEPSRLLYGTIEYFLDQRQTTVESELLQALYNELEERTEKAEFELYPLDV